MGMIGMNSLLTQREYQDRRATERGELLKYFMTELNRTRDGVRFKKLTIPRIAVLVTKIPTDDLYYMRSMMEDMRKRGGNASAWFWSSLKPKADRV
jgi:hypothetical protein